MTTPKPRKKTGPKPGTPKTPGSGRKKGTPNGTTTLLKEAILLAATNHGRDGNGTNGLEGYLTKVASEDIKAFAGLLGKVLPMQIGVDPDARAPVGSFIFVPVGADESNQD